MEVRYQREMKRNYLIVRPDDQDEDFYEAHMLEVNAIDGLLKFRIKHSEEYLLYYYEITSKQPLSRLLENRGMKAAEIRKLISGISEVLDRMERYLLVEEGIWLEAGYIYIEPDTYYVSLCFVPGRHGDFPEDMKKLLQFLLGKIDHGDKEGVVLAYGLFQESQKDNYGIKDLLKVLCGGDNRTEETEKAQRKKIEDVTVCRENAENQAAESYKKGNEKEKNRTAEKNIGRPEEKEQPKNRHRSRESWQVGVFILIACLLAAGWFIMGENWMKNYGIKIAAAASAGAVFISQILNGREKKRDGQEQQEQRTEILDKKSADFWLMELEEDEGEISEKDTVCDKPANDTALLADLEEVREGRRLISLENAGEIIRIAYYPFLIGKQEGLVDYVINCDTVSRLHLRIDEDGGRYKITDLNSTNGTIVNGRMLEANESADLLPGNEIYIADRGFLFK